MPLASIIINTKKKKHKKQDSYYSKKKKNVAVRAEEATGPIMVSFY